jgi:hypothetical protein
VSSLSSFQVVYFLKIYFSRFNATRDFASFALRAAQAYQNIVGAIDGAWESAKEAQMSAMRAKEQVTDSFYSLKICRKLDLHHVWDEQVFVEVLSRVLLQRFNNLVEERQWP